MCFQENLDPSVFRKKETRVLSNSLLMSQKSFYQRDGVSIRFKFHSELSDISL